MPATSPATLSPRGFSWGGARSGSGKKKGHKHTATPKIGKRIYLNEAQWAYLACWFPSTDVSAQAIELVGSGTETQLPGRARRFWPLGPRTTPAQSPEVRERCAGPSEKMVERARAEHGPYVGRKIYLTAAEWAWLANFHPTIEYKDANGFTRTTTESHQFRALLSLCESMWPTGPSTNPRMSPDQLALNAGS